MIAFMKHLNNILYRLFKTVTFIIAIWSPLNVHRARTKGYSYEPYNQIDFVTAIKVAKSVWELSRKEYKNERGRSMDNCF
jgi:hypothetical protein